MIKVLFVLFLIYFTSNTFAKQLPDFLTHIHPHQNIEALIQSKTKSNLTYKQIMEQFGEAYLKIQNGVMLQDKDMIEDGLNKIQNHPTTKNNPWDIVNTNDIQAFKESLLYYDALLHSGATDITNSLKNDDWIEINKNIFKLSNHCVNCHIIWQDNLNTK